MFFPEPEQGVAFYRASASLREVFTCSWGPIEAVCPISFAVIRQLRAGKRA
jgi:hypothetical protein